MAFNTTILAGLYTANHIWFVVAYFVMELGILTGLLAAVFGLLDWLWWVPANTRAKKVGLWHGLGNVVVIALFAASWLVRRALPTDPSRVALAASFAGVALAIVTGWLGGELVDRHGIGVHEGANPNASSSLSGRPAQGRTPATPARRKAA